MGGNHTECYSICPITLSTIIFHAFPLPHNCPPLILFWGFSVKHEFEVTCQLNKLNFDKNYIASLPFIIYLPLKPSIYAIQTSKYMEFGPELLLFKLMLKLFLKLDQIINATFAKFTNFKKNTYILLLYFTLHRQGYLG